MNNGKQGTKGDHYIEVRHITLLNQADSISAALLGGDQLLIDKKGYDILQRLPNDTVKLLIETASKKKYLSIGIEKSFFLKNNDFKCDVFSFRIKIKKRFLLKLKRYYNISIAFSTPNGSRLIRPILLERI